MGICLGIINRASATSDERATSDHHPARTTAAMSTLMRTLRNLRRIARNHGDLVLCHVRFSH